MHINSINDLVNYCQRNPNLRALTINNRRQHNSHKELPPSWFQKCFNYCGELLLRFLYSSQLDLLYEQEYEREREHWSNQFSSVQPSKHCLNITNLDLRALPFSLLSALSHLTILGGCDDLEVLPNLQSLTHLWIEDRNTGNLPSLPKLSRLALNNCELEIPTFSALSNLWIMNYRQVPSLPQIPQLRRLAIFNWTSLERLPNLPKLTSLEIIGGGKLEDLPLLPTLEAIFISQIDVCRSSKLHSSLSSNCSALQIREMNKGFWMASKEVGWGDWPTYVRVLPAPPLMSASAQFVRHYLGDKV